MIGGRRRANCGARLAATTRSDASEQSLARGKALAVVRPADAQQVAEVVKACAAAGAAIVPQGGNTGLVGGSVPGETFMGSLGNGYTYNSLTFAENEERSPWEPLHVERVIW